MLMRKKKETDFNMFSNIFFALKCTFCAAPVYTVYSFLFLIIGDLITLFEHVFLPAYIIGCVERKAPLYEILYFLVPIALAVLFKVSIISFVNAYIKPKSTAKIDKYIRLTLYKKAVGMDIAKYDNSKYYNDYVSVMEWSIWHIEQAVYLLGGFLSSIVVTIVAGSYVVSVDTKALFAIIIVVAINLVVQIISRKTEIKRWEEQIPFYRKSDYSNRVFYLTDFAKDLRMGSIGKKFENDFKESCDEINNSFKKYSKKLISLEIANFPLHDIVLKGIYLTYLFFQAFVKKAFGFGTLYGLYNAVRTVNEDIINIVRIFPELFEHSQYIDKIRVFLKSENKILDNGTEPIKNHGDIEVKNICFTYPGNNKPTIKNLSMTIKKGEKIAFVGFNGAGKSTLIKLLLRLYDVDSGEIYFDGKPITDYPLSEYRAVYSTLFQDFEIIAATVGQNLTMDNVSLDKQSADDALKASDFKEKFDTLPNGYDTNLTKEFDQDGVNLSGGEAQKLALARVLYANKNIIILDEPSSALDPLAEYQLNKTITELAKDKTVIIISHRLSTTRFVDKIYMLEDGTVAECGNHDELLKQNGKYAQMFRLQAEKYR